MENPKITHKLLIFVLRHIPPVGALLMWGHISLLLAGVNVGTGELIGGTPVFMTVLMLLCSYVFKFCALHRAFIYYNAAVYLCIHFQRWSGFGEWLTPMRWVMFFAGALLLLYLIINYKEHCSHGQ